SRRRPALSAAGRAPGSLHPRVGDGARRDGWVGVVEEFEEGLNAAAAPVRGPEGTVIAALSVAGPTYRLGPADLPGAGAELIRAATEISRRLGHRAGVTG